MRAVPVNHATAKEVMIHSGIALMQGNLVVPDNARGIVLFAHGSGSSRFSPRNRHVAKILHEQTLATLLFDLLTKEEEAIDEDTRELRFDIPLLTRRLVAATDWVLENEELQHLKIGYFGSSTGAAAAIDAATLRPENIRAVVSRGGRPDLAGAAALSMLKAATLLIVGGRDYAVIEMNKAAFDEMQCEKRFAVVSGATHLFEEPGTLDHVAELAASWFRDHLK